MQGYFRFFPALTSAPQQSVHLDASHGLLERVHVGLVVPRLHVEDDVRLGDHLRLLRLLRGVRSQTGEQRTEKSNNWL